jgi:hypothetical protein
MNIEKKQLLSSPVRKKEITAEHPFILSGKNPLRLTNKKAGEIPRLFKGRCFKEEVTLLLPRQP